MGRPPDSGSSEGLESEGAPAGLPGAEASLLRQSGRGFFTGVVAAVVFALCVMLLVLVVLPGLVNGEAMIVNGDAKALPVAFVAAIPFAVVVGALVGPVPGVLGGLAAGLAARRVHTLRALRLTVALAGAALATATILVLGLLTGGVVPFLLGVAIPAPALPGVPVPYNLSGGYVLAAAYGALVGALHACWAASGPTTLTRPCGSLTCVPSLLLIRPR
jgi:hypothetical protein